MKTALTIAGSDSSGGAGIQADLKTFSVLGVYGMSAITAVTAQNTLGVKDVVELAPAMVRNQIDTTAAPVSLDGIQNVTPTCLPSSGTTETAAEVAVVIEGFAFNEATIEVAAGTTVMWTNNDTTPHTVTSADGTFDSGRLDGGATFSFTFTEPGEYAYACEFHPGMQGTIVVTD